MFEHRENEFPLVFCFIYSNFGNFPIGINFLKS